MGFVRNTPIIQKIHRNGATIVWYSNNSESSEVKIGTTFGTYTNVYNDSTAVPTSGAGDTNYRHELKIRGLKPNTKYFYTVGPIGSVYQGTADNFFWTSPDTNTAQNMRIWAMADMGVSGGGQAAVVTGFNAFNGSSKFDMILQVGDLVYSSGAWSEFDARWFSTSPGYASYLKKAPVFAALGNHDYGSGGGNPQANINNLPYSKIFSNPILNDAGGVASRDLRWYSFDYGQLHVISLDGWYYRNGADGLSLEPGSPQYNWLVNDLENFAAERTAGNKTWCILIEHFPAFSKGSHNSDTESWCVGMRTFIGPLVYQYNIDLVLHGHSHIYERSYFINGFTGLDSQWNTSFLAQPGKGDNSTPSDLPYDKTTGQVGAVFMTIGNGGQPTGSSSTSSGYPYGTNVVNFTTPWNSVVIDISTSGGSHTMHVKTISDTTGTIDDQFIINR